MIGVDCAGATRNDPPQNDPGSEVDARAAAPGEHQVGRHLHRDIAAREQRVSVRSTSRPGITSYPQRVEKGERRLVLGVREFEVSLEAGQARLRDRVAVDVVQAVDQEAAKSRIVAIEVDAERYCEAAVRWR